MIRAVEREAAALGLARRYVERKDLDGGWFELGGSSIDAARLVSALDTDLGVALSLRTLLEAESVRECLAAAVARGPVGSGAAATRASESGVAGRFWPALASLPATERIRLAHALLGEVVRRTG